MGRNERGPLEAQQARRLSAAALPDAQRVLVGSIAVAEVLRPALNGADEFECGEAELAAGIDHELRRDGAADRVSAEHHGTCHAPDEPGHLALIFKHQWGELRIEPRMLQQHLHEVSLQRLGRTSLFVAKTPHPQCRHLFDVGMRSARMLPGSFDLVNLANGLDEERLGVLIGGGPSLGIDVAIGALDLLFSEPGRDGHLGRRNAMIQPPKAQVHLVVGQREVELLLDLRQRVGVGGGRPAADFLGNAQCSASW